jgi:hypothetical protein
MFEFGGTKILRKFAATKAETYGYVKIKNPVAISHNGIRYYYVSI